MSGGGEAELENLIGDGKSRKGCCTAHPKVCCTLLSIMLGISFVVLLVGSTTHSIIDAKVQDAIADVSLAAEVAALLYT